MKEIIATALILLGLGAGLVVWMLEIQENVHEMWEWTRKLCRDTRDEIGKLTARDGLPASSAFYECPKMPEADQ